MPVRRLAILALCALLVFSSGAEAQRRSSGGTDPKFELSPIVGYTMTSSIQFSDERVDLTNGWNLGGTLGIRSFGGRLIEVTYNYLGSDIVGFNRYPVAPDTTYGKMNQHMIQVGGVNEFSDGNVRPFLSGSLGMTIFSPDVVGASDITRFAVSAAIGVKAFNATERIGVRLQSRFWFNFVNSSFGLICGPYGCGGAYSGSGIFQWEPSAGLVIAF
jgi:hypothetical protein